LTCASVLAEGRPEMAMTSSTVTREIWAIRDGVKLHAHEWRPRDGELGVPILGVGGAISKAANAKEFGIAAATGALGARRRLISLDRRGMGGSSAPAIGYTPREFTMDNEAIVAAAELDDFVVYGHSLGVPIAIAYVLQHRDEVRGLVLGDYPAVWPRLSEEWLARALAVFDGSWSREGLTQMQHESVETSYWDDLRTLKMPVLAVTGTAGGVRVSAEDAERYRSTCGAGSLVVIDGADHSLTVNGDKAPFLAVLRGFLTGVDRRRSTP
jgi:pimeloyl-ACP methyl ester carboxylesterase